MKLTLLEILIILLILATGLSIYTCTGRYIESQPERVMFREYPDLAIDMTGVPGDKISRVLYKKGWDKI